MKKIVITLALLFAVCSPVLAQRNSNADSLRLVTGQVLSQIDAPIPNAVVYLKNVKTLTVKTYITDSAGNYRFPALSRNVDYQIYAEYKGKRSDTKILSSLDSRTEATLNLHVEASQ